MCIKKKKAEDHKEKMIEIRLLTREHISKSKKSPKKKKFNTLLM